MSRGRRATRGRRAQATLVTAVLPLVVVATACSTGGLPQPVTEQGESVVTQWRVFLWGAVGVAALIWVLVAYAVITSVRRRKAEDANDPDSDIPVQSQYRTKLEIVYTVIPLVVVMGLFALSLWGNQQLADADATPDLTVNVRGFQWQWQFNYEAQRVTVGGADDVLPDLYLPVGSTVLFKLEADDVIHSFWVPDFLEKRDLIPGVHTNTIKVSVAKPGTFIGRCAEYCGLEHWQMKFNVYAVPKAQFDDWIAQQPKDRPFVKGVFTTEGGTASTTTTLPPTSSVPVTEVRTPPGSGSVTTGTRQS